MALTIKEAEEKYLERMHNFFVRCERKIDKALVNDFGDLRVHNSIVFYLPELIKEYLTLEDKKNLTSLIKEKYSEWQVEYTEIDKSFIFKYTSPDTSFLYLYGGNEERFANLDIRTEDETGAEGNDYFDDEDDIPF